MKKLATAIAAIALIGTPAFAQAPPPPPAPVYNWTGWYVGVNAGASFGNVKTDFNAPATAGVIFNSGTFPAFANVGFAGSNTEYPSGFMGGGQIGYNWQVSPIWVVGFEADFQGALERDSNTLTSNFTGAPLIGSNATVTGSTVLDYQTKIEWFGTARLRAGYVWGNGNVFSYVTGGFAYGKVDVEGTSTVSGVINPPFFLPPFSATAAIGHSQVNTGWVVGYGTEGVIDFWGARNWTWKIEGLYMDLGHLDATGPGASFSKVVRFTPSAFDIVAATVGPVTTHSHFTDGILRAGLNYKFY
jgi:outer membrane immunogenic protein